MRRLFVALLVLSLVPASARADRTQIYSVTGVDCADCANPVKAQVHKLKGVKKADFDIHTVELTVTMDDAVKDADVVAAVEHAGRGFHATTGAGHGAYLAAPSFPAGADVTVLTHDGSAVGPLAKLRVPGKFTMFDVYADWCGPCRTLDAHMRDVLSTRTDVALRKLNVVSFDTPLAKELGGRLAALPYVVVYAPDGRRTEIVDGSAKRIDAALAPRR